MKTQLRNLLLALSTVVAASGAHAGGTSDLVIAVTKNPTRLDPMAENSNVNLRVMKNVLETLIRTDYADNGALVPGLATSWQRVDDRTVEFQLREGVTCQNGETFDAEDVAFSLGPDRFFGEAAPGWSVGQQYLGGLESVEAVDPLTVRIRFKEADPLIELRFANWMSEMVCKDAFEAAGSWEVWLQHPVGTGPYQVAEMVQGEKIVLTANDSYWGGKPPAASLTFKVVPETATRIAGLKNGEFDIATEIMPDQFAIIQDDPNTKVVGGAINSIRTLVYDEKNPVLADPRVRQALNLAIDRDLIAETIFGGFVGVPKGMQMPDFGPLYIEDYQASTYDPERAKALLAEAGYNGAEISYRYLQDYYPGEVDTAQILAEMWRQVGLNVKLELKENWAQIEDDPVGRGIFNWSNGATYPDPLGQIYRLYGPKGWFQTHGAYESAEFNEWGSKLFTVDQNVRIEAMRHLLEIYERSDPPGTHLHYMPMFYGVRKDLDWSQTTTPFMDFSQQSLRVSG